MSADSHPQSLPDPDSEVAVPGDSLHWRERRRRNILAAAEELFAQSSYDAVQMDDIARRAKVGKPTIYRYFASKDELFLEVFRLALQQLQFQLSGVLAAELHPHKALDEIFRISFGLLGNQVSALRLLTDGQPGLIVRWREEFDRHRLFLVSTFRQVIERGVTMGAFRAVDLDMVPPMMVGMVRGGLMSVTDIPARQQMSQAAVDLVIGSLMKA
ncbi:MAG TPA: helix-turn-helix domain-containing protein [Dongiaceae bacterium]|nr:helix-turn-helix domain-containing protein [Dongiaceae bacterium]